MFAFWLSWPPRRELPVRCTRRLGRVGMALLALGFLAPLLHPRQLRTLPPVEASITRVATATGMQAHGAAWQAASAGSTRALDLLRLPARVQSAPGYATRAALPSVALGRTLDYWVYLPPNYHHTERRYPVLYMLHGLNGNSATWRAWGLFDAAERLIRDKQIAPLIIVTPQGDNGYWMNHVHNGPRWEDYLANDVVRHVDITYRTLATRHHRAVGGVSMGGHGAIRMMLTHPELFGAAGGHSPVFRDLQQAFPFYGTGADYEQRDPVSLVGKLHVPVAGPLFIDMGADDDWLPRTRYFHEQLLQLGVQHEWQLGPGGHATPYWMERVSMYLRWYDAVLREPAALPGGRL